MTLHPSFRDLLRLIVFAAMMFSHVSALDDQSISEAFGLSQLSHVVLIEEDHTETGKIRTYTFVDDIKLMKTLEKQLLKTPAVSNGNALILVPIYHRVIVVDDQNRAMEFVVFGNYITSPLNTTTIATGGWIAEWIQAAIALDQMQKPNLRGAPKD